MSNDIPTKARELVRERQGGQCWRCGNTYTALHHRMRRREGGHGVQNLVGVCGTCHNWVHKHPAAATEQGYIIPIHVTDISATPIKAFFGWVTFTNDGDYVLMDDN
jgi:5-methylcytosine-specific restriction endonuclease McrA